MNTLVTQHFGLEEFACHDGTPYPVKNVDDATQQTWLVSRLVPLCETLEVIRTAGGHKAITITSGYRTPTYQQRLKDKAKGTVGSASGSQHPQGRACDITHATLLPQQLHALITRLYREKKLPHLGGLGIYETFLHIDVRPRVKDHLAQWSDVPKPSAVA